jgi:Tol biopolymer transport system component
MSKHIELGLLPGFLEDFAVTPDGTHIVVFGSCGYSGGMAVIDLKTQTSKVIVQAQPAHSPPTNLPCGQSSVFVSDRLIALGHVSALLPGDVAGQILYVDSASGKVQQSVAVSAEPIALVALP